MDVQIPHNGEGVKSERSLLCHCSCWEISAIGPCRRRAENVLQDSRTCPVLVRTAPSGFGPDSSPPFVICTNHRLSGSASCWDVASSSPGVDAGFPPPRSTSFGTLRHGSISARSRTGRDVAHDVADHVGRHLCSVPTTTAPPWPPRTCSGTCTARPKHKTPQSTARGTLRAQTRTEGRKEGDMVCDITLTLTYPSSCSCLLCAKVIVPLLTLSLFSFWWEITLGLQNKK